MASLMKILKSKVDNLQHRFNDFKASLSTPPIQESSQALSAWFATPLGKYIIQAERQMLEQELNNLFGYHLMQLSVVPEENLTTSSRINHCFALNPCLNRAKHLNQYSGIQACNVKAAAEFTALPLPDEVVDVTILHHVLDFTDQPQQVLKEAARVTISRGYILIFGFNPNSLTGLVQPFANLFRLGAIWRRNRLRTSRIKDWLEFLDCSSVGKCYAHRNLPVNNESYIQHAKLPKKWGGIGRIPGGSIYCILARKDKVGLTPIKRSWVSADLIGVVPLPEPVRTSSNAAARIKKAQKGWK